jgi:protoheme IX farnesyltransferase
MENTAILSETMSVPYQGAGVGDYVELLKPRVMSLVVFSGLVGLLVAPVHVHPLLGFVAVLCIALSAGGSAAVNMWYDRDIDVIMTRTRRRPLPQGRIEAQSALEFGATLIFISVVMMALAIGWLAAFLLAAASAFYIFIYTFWLKRRTPWNIVIGGAADDWLGGGNGASGLACVYFVCDHFFLDAAAFLGARALS